MRISDFRYHYSDSDVPAEKPFYFKPYLHLQQQQWQQQALQQQQQQQQQQHRKGSRKGGRFLPWNFPSSEKKSPQPSEPRRSLSTTFSSMRDASFSVCACGAGDILGRTGRKEDGEDASCREEDNRPGDNSDQKQSPSFDSLKTYWIDFLSQTSWHGCRTIVDPKKRMYLRIIFFLIVIITALALGTIAFNLTRAALDFKTVTRTMVFVDSDRRFPTVTICNLCPFSFRDKNESDPFFRVLANASEFAPILPPISTSDAQFQRFMARSADEIFSEYVMRLGLVYGEYGNTIVTENDFQTIFTELGPCYQFNGPQQASERGHWNVTSHGRDSGLRLVINIHQDEYGIVFDNNAGIRVFVSHVSESPDLKAGGVNVMPGTSATLALTQNEYSFLPSPYRSYGSESCVETDKHSDRLRKKMPTDEAYDFQRCRDLCVVKMASFKCACYITGLKLPGLPPCKTFDFLYGCMRLNIDNLTRNFQPQCDCPRPCSFVRYGIVVSSSQMTSKASLPYTMKYLNFTDEKKLRENVLELRVFFESDLVRRESHEEQYSPQSYLSSLGGQMGICMGASLISLAELLEALLHTGLVLLHCCIAKLRSIAQRDKSTARSPTH